MRMKAIIASILVFILIIMSCSAEEVTPEFKGMNDPDLLPYIEDTLYAELVSTLDSEEYFVENVSAIYISEEYLEELEFNSQSNIYFGYTLAELEAQFQGDRYVFTLGADNETTVEPWEAYDDTYDRVLKNVAIGTGVILICVTVSVVTAGAGAPAVSMIFAVAAKSGATCALSGAALGGVSAGVVTGIQTGDMDAALKSAALAGSEGYKWGAITGAIAGGAGEAIALKGATMNGLTMNEAAIIQRESNYPLSVIKEFHSYEEYNIYKEAGLMNRLVGNKAALIRDIDLTQKDAFGRTNLERMLNGDPALDPTGVSYELHHVGQKNDSIFAVLTQSEHRGAGNFAKLHKELISSEVDHGAAFAAAKKEFWIALGKILSGGV